jgi:hypothetical protein
MNTNKHEYFSLFAPQALKTFSRRDAEIAEEEQKSLRTLRLCG